MKSELANLIAVQELDIKIREIEKEIADIPNQQADIEDQFKTIAAEYLDKQTRLETARKEQRQVEIDLKEHEDKLEKFKQDLMQVQNERAYTTVLREIDLTKKAISTLETQALEKIEVIETLEKEIQSLTPEIETKRGEFDEKIQECATRADSLAADLIVWRQQRIDLGKVIAPDLLARYDRLTHLRDGMAMAEVRDGSCTACFMTIRPQAYADVRKGETIITCDNCARILYYQSSPQQESQSAG